MHACVFSHVRFFETPRTIAHQAPLSMGFPRQEYWKGLQLPPLGYLLDPGIKPTSPASPTLQVDSLPLSYKEPLMTWLFWVRKDRGGPIF